MIKIFKWYIVSDLDLFIEKDTACRTLSRRIKYLEKEIQRLEKDNDTLSELVIVNEDKVIKELDLISKDKIRDMLNYLDNTSLNNYEIVMAFRKMMKELLEENDGDHIPRID